MHVLYQAAVTDFLVLSQIDVFVSWSMHCLVVNKNFGMRVIVRGLHQGMTASKRPMTSVFLHLGRHGRLKVAKDGSMRSIIELQPESTKPLDYHCLRIVLALITFCSGHLSDTLGLNLQCCISTEALSCSMRFVSFQSRMLLVKRLT